MMKESPPRSNLMKTKLWLPLLASAFLSLAPSAGLAQQLSAEGQPIPPPPIPAAPGAPVPTARTGPPIPETVEFNVAFQSEIPDCAKPLPSPVPRLLQVLSLIDQGKFEFFGSYYSPRVIQEYGLERLVDQYMRPWYGELRENGGLVKVVIKRIAFEADQAFVTYVVVEKNGNTDNETTNFVLGEDGQWYLRDHDL